MEFDSELYTALKTAVSSNTREADIIRLVVNLILELQTLKQVIKVTNTLEGKNNYIGSSSAPTWKESK